MKTKARGRYHICLRKYGVAACLTSKGQTNNIYGTSLEECQRIHSGYEATHLDICKRSQDVNLLIRYYDTRASGVFDGVPGLAVLSKHRKGNKDGAQKIRTLRFKHFFGKTSQ